MKTLLLGFAIGCAPGAAFYLLGAYHWGWNWLGFGRWK